MMRRRIPGRADEAGPATRAADGPAAAPAAAQLARDAHPVSSRLLGRPPTLLDRAAARGASALPRNARMALAAAAPALATGAWLKGSPLTQGRAGVATAGAAFAVYSSMRWLETTGPTRRTMLAADRITDLDALLPLLDDLTAHIEQHRPGARNPVADRFDVYGPTLLMLTHEGLGHAFAAWRYLVHNKPLNAATGLSTASESAEDPLAMVSTFDMARVKGHAQRLLQALLDQQDPPVAPDRKAVAQAYLRSPAFLDIRTPELSSSAGQFWLRAWSRRQPDAALHVQAIVTALSAAHLAGLNEPVQAMAHLHERLMQAPDAERLALATSPVSAALLAGHDGPVEAWRGLMAAEEAPRAQDVAAAMSALLGGARPRDRPAMRKHVLSVVKNHPSVLARLGGNSAVTALLAADRIAAELHDKGVPFKPIRVDLASSARRPADTWRDIEKSARELLTIARQTRTIPADRSLAASAHIQGMVSMGPAGSDERLSALEDLVTQRGLPRNAKAHLHATRGGRILLQHLEQWHGAALPDQRELVLAQWALNSVSTALEPEPSLADAFETLHRGREAMASAQQTRQGRDAVALLLDNYARRFSPDTRDGVTRAIEYLGHRLMPEAMRVVSGDPAQAIDGAGQLAADALLNSLLEHLPGPSATRLDGLDPGVQAGHALSLLDGLRTDHPDLLNEGQLSRAYLHLARRDAPQEAVAQAAGMAGDAQLNQLEALAQRPAPTGQPTAASVGLWRRVLAERHPDLPDDPNAYAWLIARQALARANLSDIPGLDEALRAQLRALEDQA